MPLNQSPPLLGQSSLPWGQSRTRFKKYGNPSFKNGFRRQGMNMPVRPNWKYILREIRAPLITDVRFGYRLSKNNLSVVKDFYNNLISVNNNSLILFSKEFLPVELPQPITIMSRNWKTYGEDKKVSIIN